MPLVKSKYEPISPWGHMQTILPNIFRKVDFIDPEEVIIETDDGDFLELDKYIHKDNDKVAIISHGLEGNSRRVYVRGMARMLYDNGYDVIAWNFRSCGSKMNRLLRFYHSGETSDIHRIVQYAEKEYEKIVLVGFSLGGNVTLKYLGEQGEKISEKVKAACAISAPVDLMGSSLRMMRRENKLYMSRFIRKMRKKLEKKKAFFPNEINLEGYEKVKNFKDFDNRYTAPIHGFKNAGDYWRSASSLYYLENIRVPTLLLNARNDSFLNRTCYPYEIAADSDYFFLEVPRNGGHVGFWRFNKSTWSERRTIEFMRQVVPTS